MADKDMLQRYKNTFSGMEGRAVLADILLTCHCFGTLDPENQAQIGEYNVGMTIAAKAGFIDQLQIQLGFSGPSEEE